MNWEANEHSVDPSKYTTVIYSDMEKYNQYSPLLQDYYYAIGSEPNTQANVLHKNEIRIDPRIGTQNIEDVDSSSFVHKLINPEVQVKFRDDDILHASVVQDRMARLQHTDGLADSLSSSQYFTQASSSSDCEGQCLNGGICFKGDCICAKGYFGQYCQELTAHPGEYHAKDAVEQDPFGDSAQKRNRKDNGINYLEHTPEEEVPADFYLKEVEKQQLNCGGSGNNQGFVYPEDDNTDGSNGSNGSGAGNGSSGSGHGSGSSSGNGSGSGNGNSRGSRNGTVAQDLEAVQVQEAEVQVDQAEVDLVEVEVDIKDMVEVQDQEMIKALKEAAMVRMATIKLLRVLTVAQAHHLQEVMHPVGQAGENSSGGISYYCY